MRNLIIKRINDLRNDARFNAHRLFGKNCYYSKHETFETYSDENLLIAFERICSYAYKQF